VAARRTDEDADEAEVSVRLRDLNPFWRQLPVYSPVTFGSLWAGLAGAIGWGTPLERLHLLLASEYGTSDLRLTDSGTSALRLAIEGGCAETGSDVVALPAYCCFDVATAAVGADSRVALYDVCPETLGPDFDSARAALEAGARTLVVAHLYGVPVDLDASRELADEYGAVLIEDAAQGAGGSWRSKPLGSWGDLGVLSFGRGKGRTGGGGGALLANSPRGISILADLPAIPRAGGGAAKISRLAAQWAFGRPSLYGIPASLPFLGLGETTYKEPWEPRGMSTGPAAALLVNWGPSKMEEDLRRAHGPAGFGCQIDGGSHLAGYLLPIPGKYGSAVSIGWLRIPVITTCEVSTLQQARRGVQRGYPTTLADILETNFVDEAKDRPGATKLARMLATFPVHRWCVSQSAADTLLEPNDGGV
jgi:hypothetical protein